MENKVLLYDSNGNKIGKTFIRRAKQLVRQQRAVWTDDNQNAIRFAPGMENMDIVITGLAEKRASAKLGFKIHVITVIVLCYAIAVGHRNIIGVNPVWVSLAILVLGLSVAIHAMIVKSALVSSRKIAAEYEFLKKLGGGK